MNVAYVAGGAVLYLAFGRAIGKWLKRAAEAQRYVEICTDPDCAICADIRARIAAEIAWLGRP